MSALKNGSTGPSASGIAYRRELERLRGERPTPTIGRDYTIGGSTEQAIHRELDALRERRIGVIENRLTREVKGHLENEFGISQQRDRAKKDFERSR